MIDDYMLNDMLEVLAELRTSKYNFHLTGSRFFGNATSDSDYDFFVQRSKEVIEFLEHLDFHKVEGAYVDTTYSWRDMIHVQVIKDAEIRAVIRDQFANTGLMLRLNRGRRKELWQFAMDLVSEFK